MAEWLKAQKNYTADILPLEAITLKLPCSSENKKPPTTIASSMMRMETQEQSKTNTHQKTTTTNVYAHTTHS